MIPPRLGHTDDATLEKLLATREASYWDHLGARTRQATTLEELLFLSNLRKKALEAGFRPAPEKRAKLKLALVGGYTLFPLHEAIEHVLSASGFDVETFVGDYDNYDHELLDPKSRVYEFKPDVIFVLPSERRARATGGLLALREQHEQEVKAHARGLLDLCKMAHDRTGAEILLANYRLPGRFDLGPYRTRTLGSEWAFKRAVNTELGLTAPSYVHVCDCEFLAARRGTLASADPRSWFRSKQPGAAEYLLDMALEVDQLVRSLKKSPKKVLALDLDNTLWGGVIGDDGLEGIVLGDTSAKGEAYKDFQKYVLSLHERGVLLAVCSKNDHDKAAEPFEKHPEMVLKMEHLAGFKANWNPKSDNLRALATELNLGLDSFVFVDDNPAEIEIVRQFVPEVTTLLLGPSPADFVGQLADSRLFEPVSITREDAERTQQYRQEAQRKALQESVTDMDAFLRSLDMHGTVAPFREVDVPRIAQLINKSNQFNLTTRRRTEGEVAQLAQSANHACFTVRLSDKFGDYGLIAVVVGEVRGKTFEIDTWLMSCRVLNRQVEEEVLNEIFRLANARKCEKVVGRYIPTSKNQMVRDLYERFGFAKTAESVYERSVADFKSYATRIATEILRS